jgi:hypothetical protein
MTGIVIASLTENVWGGGHNHSITKDSFAITRQQSAACYDETSLSVLLNHKCEYISTQSHITPICSSLFTATYCGSANHHQV